MHRCRAAVWFATVLSFGVLVMLFTLAIAAGDTNVGNSNEPWIAGDAIFLGTPIVIAAVGYRLLRRTDTAPRRALAIAGAVAVAIPFLVLGAAVALVAASS
jgi:hypothetical protein